MRSRENIGRRLAILLTSMIALLIIMCFGRTAQATQRFMDERAGLLAGQLSSMETLAKKAENDYRLQTGGTGQFVTGGTGQDANGGTGEITQDGSDEPAARIAITGGTGDFTTGGSGEEVAVKKAVASNPTKPEPKPAAAEQPAPAKNVYAALTGPDEMNVAHCVPQHFELRSSDMDGAKLYVEKGADWYALKQSCLSKYFRTDAEGVIRANPVQTTIPWCRIEGRIEFDPSRYQDVLSDIKPLVLGAPANLDFIDECQAEGSLGLALQERQLLKLSAVNDEDEAEESATAEPQAQAPKAPSEEATVSVAPAETPDKPEPRPADASQEALAPDGSLQNSPVPDAGAGGQSGDVELPSGIPTNASDVQSTWRQGTDEADAWRADWLLWDQKFQSVRHGMILLRATSPPSVTSLWPKWPEFHGDLLPRLVLIFHGDSFNTSAVTYFGASRY